MRLLGLDLGGRQIRHALAQQDFNGADLADGQFALEQADGLPLSVVELGRLPCRLAIQETVRTAGVEAQHPVPDDLKSDTADLGRLGARCPIVDIRECEKPASLRPVFGLPCQTANLWRTKILAPWCRSRHDEPPGFAMLNPATGLLVT